MQYTSREKEGGTLQKSEKSKVEIAEEYRRKGMLDDAILILRECIKEDKDNTDAYILLMDILLQTDDIPGARDVAENLKEVVSGREDEAEILLRIAEVFAYYEEVKDALHYVNESLRIKPTAEGWNLRGNLMFLMDRYESALRCYNEALKLNGDNEEVWNNKGFIHFVLQEYDKAIEHFKKAIEINPDYRSAYYNLAYTYHAMNELDKAIEYYEKSLDIDPNDEVCWNNLGNAYYNLGRYMESIPYFMFSLLVNQKYEIAWNNIGNALDKMGFHEISIFFHDKAIECNPKFDYAWYAKGYANYKLGNKKKAYQYVMKALSLNDSNDYAWNLLAKLYWEEGDLIEEAIDAAKKAVEINPENIDNLKTLYEFLKESGRIYDARKILEKIIDKAEGEEKGRWLMEAGRYEDALNYLKGKEKMECLFVLGKYEDIVESAEDGEELYYKTMAYVEMEKYEDALKTLEKIPEEMRDDRYKEIKMVCMAHLGYRINIRDVLKLSTKSALRICSALYDSGRISEAKKILEKLRRRGEEEPLIYRILSDIYEREGKIKIARRYRLIYRGFANEKI